MQNAYLYFSFSGLFIALVSLFLGVLVLWRNPRSAVNRTFSLFCLTIVVWAAAYVFWPLAQTADGTLMAFQVLHLGACFIPVAYYHFVTRWLGIYERKRAIVFLGYLTAAAIAATIPTAFFIKRMVPQLGMRFWADPGPLYFSYLALFFGFFLFSSYLLYRGYRQESGIKKQQIKYVLIGIVLGFAGGSTNYLLWFDIRIPPYGNILASAFVIFTAYSILRYRLLDMRLIGRQLTIYGIDSLVVYLLYCGVLVLSPFFGGSAPNSYAFLAGIVAAPVFIIFLLWFHHQVMALVDRYFFYSLYDYKKTISAVTAELSNYNDLDKIINLIVNTIKQTMGLNRAGVLLADRQGKETHYKIAKVIGFDITNGISLVKDNFLTKHLKLTSKPLVREELPYISQDTRSPKEAQAFLNLAKEMEHIEASLCLPLLRGNQLMGIIVLGAKETGDPYTDDDLNLLGTLANQAAIALDNARMYQETKNFNKVLQQKVDEQTKDIKAKAEHLQKLLKMREEFLDIASHQLKTPISVIRGTLSMFREGSMDHLSKAEQHKFMDNIYHKTEKLNVIISDILRASEIDSEEFKIDPAKAQEVQVADTINAVYDDLKELADEKGIKLIKNLPQAALPKILTSADFFEQAIYNLVDNAIKYTAKGSVTVDLSGNDKELAIVVRDTGIGVPESDKKKIFDKFARAKNAVDMYADGSGLGLYIVKRVIEAHPGGSISMESKENEGTAFTIKLPLGKPSQAGVKAAAGSALAAQPAPPSAVLGRVSRILKPARRLRAHPLAAGLKKKPKSGKLAKDKTRHKI